MDSGKTAMAIMKAHEYRTKNRKILVLKPKIDTRSRGNLLDSRIGVSTECIDIPKLSKISDFLNPNIQYDLLLVDEAQFLTTEQVLEIKRLPNIRLTLLYGLKNNYLGKLFEGTRAILEICDNIREIPCQCSKCSNKATQNGRFDGEKLVTSGNVIDIGGNEKYKPLCFDCFDKLRNL